MKNPIKISNQLSAAGQPTEEDLKRLAEAGFTAVVNQRTESESNYLLPREYGRKQAKAVGLDDHQWPPNNGERQ